jgi:hypothetical protein
VRATTLLAAALAFTVVLPAGAQRRAREVPLQAPAPATPAPTVPAPSSATQAEPAPLATDSSADEITVTLITFGPGEQVWERFGHNALWIHDGRAGTDVAWNWGLFDFAQPDFLQRFLSGDTKYWMAGEDAYRMIAAYHEMGRTITLQRLALTQPQAAALRDFVQWNALDQNKYYRYDYFRDNCSTRLRDALDRALGGALKRATDTVRTSLTYRGESVRLTDGLAPVQLGIDVALGRPADEPLTEWQSFFIPMRLRDALRAVTIPSANGTPVALVSDQRTIPPSSGPVVKVPAEPPSLVLRYFVLGVLLAALAFVLRVLARSNRGAMWGLALLGMLWSLLCGVLGVLLIYMWAFTRHVFWGWNENLLLLSPLSLALLVLLPAALLRSRSVRPARALSRIIAVLGVLAFFMSIAPGGQANLAIVALVLPLHLALAWALSLPLPERERRAPAT